jgi:hypothetical protein
LAHDHGVRIESCDNPGWWVKINLEKTELETRAFTEMAVNVDPDGHPKADRWLCCHVDQGVWHGAGDKTMLPDILKTFLTWASGSPSTCRPDSAKNS